MMRSAGSPRRPPVTHRATPIAPTAAWAATDAAVADRCHPLYRDAIARAPGGSLASRGLPFEMAGNGADRRWLLVDEARCVELGGVRATHLVLLTFCDAWRDEQGGRPPGTPVGWVLPVGEPLARARVTDVEGGQVGVMLRRRFEVNEGIIGWGAMAFLALPHRVERPLEWRGPHPRLGEGRYAPAGHAGPMTVLPGSWGPDQTGVEDHVPSTTDDLTLWLHAIDVSLEGRPRRLDRLDLEPVAGAGQGRLLVVAAVTAFAGSASPLRWAPRRSLAVSGARDRAIGVDLGIVARRRPLARPSPSGPVAGWGVTPGAPLRVEEPAEVEELVVAAAADAELVTGRRRIPLASLRGGSDARRPDGVVIVALPAADRRLTVTVLDEADLPVAARVRFVARDGRYLPPLGHRTEVDPGLAEDGGGDVLLAGAAYAYVDGAFEVDLPAEGASLEVVAGLERPALEREVGAEDVAGGRLTVTMGRPVVPSGGRWIAGDTHVHFLAPSTALLQARAEGVNVVHLLATQWGDHHTGLADLGGDIVDAAGDRAVWVGSENRQNMLGHVGLVGTRTAVLPFASGGPPEGPIGGPATHLVADWLRRCRELGGLAIGAHFPLPMAEVAADIDAGLLDALELQCFDPTLESPPLREWYRYLGAGYRLPLVGGTDKMSAEVPLGQVRTWARLADDEPLTFGAWASALRAGRTFVSSGPILELRVEGRGPGDLLDVSAGSRLEVEVEVRAAQPVISALELVHDGAVVLSRVVDRPATSVHLRGHVVVERSGWLAARSRSPFAIGSGFASAMAAHTSALYVDVPGRPRAGADMSVPLALVDGTRAWVEQLAPVRDEQDRERFRRFLDEAERRLRAKEGGDR